MKAALMIVDMVKDFTEPAGAVYYPETGAILPNIRKVLQKCRENHVLIVFLQQRMRKGKPDPAFAGMRPNCIEGSGGEELDSSLTVEEGDYIIPKRRYSGFFGTDLDLVLRENGIDTVVVAGTKTNCCVRATVEDAFYRNYKVVVLSDCVSTNSEEITQVHLDDIRRYFGTVTDSGTWLQCLGKEA